MRQRNISKRKGKKVSILCYMLNVYGQQQQHHYDYDPEVLRNMAKKQWGYLLPQKVEQLQMKQRQLKLTNMKKTIFSKVGLPQGQLHQSNPNPLSLPNSIGHTSPKVYNYMCSSQNNRKGVNCIVMHKHKYNQCLFRK